MGIEWGLYTNRRRRDATVAKQDSLANIKQWRRWLTLLEEEEEEVAYMAEYQTDD